MTKTKNFSTIYEKTNNHMQNIETINQLFNFSTSNMSEREADMCTIAPNRLMDLYERKKNTFCGIGGKAACI